MQELWYVMQVNKTLEKFDETEFVPYNIRNFGFSGLISEEGLEKMKDMGEIKAIELNYYGFADSFSLFFNLKWFVYFFLILIISSIIFAILKLKSLKNVKKN